MQENYWLYNFDVTSVGGMFGLGYGCETCNTLWQNVDSPQFGVFLGTENDLNWFYTAQNRTQDSTHTSLLTLGSNTNTIFGLRGTGDILTLTNEAINDDDWFFTASSFKFQDTQLLQNGYNQVTFSLALPGIGFPESVYQSVMTQIQGYDSRIVCAQSYGGLCRADTTCADLSSNLASLRFSVKFGSETEGVTIPIEAIMKESTNSGKTQCKVLLHNLGSNTQSGAFVLGTSFFQQFQGLFNAKSDVLHG